MNYVLSIETIDGKQIPTSLFSKSCIFKTVDVRPQKGEIVIDDDNNYYEIIGSVWTNDVPSVCCLKTIIKQVSSEIKKDVMLLHIIPYDSSRSRVKSIEYMNSYRDYIERMHPHISHIYVFDFGYKPQHDIKIINNNDENVMALITSLKYVQDEFIKEYNEKRS